jgi:SPP1 family predicted phage head-tail adaptor
MLSTRIEAGKLRHRIRITQPGLNEDAFGDSPNDDASLIATVWASIEALTGRELYAAQQRVAEVTHKITIRWMPEITSRLNVLFENRMFQVQDVLNPDERRKMLVLLCIERDNSAREQAK